MSASCTIEGRPGGGARIFASVQSDGQRYVRIDVGGGSLSIFLTTKQAGQLAKTLINRPSIDGATE